MRAFSLSSLVLLLLLLPQWSLAQQSDAKVDSVFSKHFASIEKSGTGNQLSREDAFFIQLLGHLSGIKDYFWCYANMGLTKGGLFNYQNWYIAHRPQITWDTMQQGFSLMSIPMLSIDSDSFNIAQDRRYKALESLRIK